MIYFIVNAPYEKCFDFFFKDELGYPNFYRVTELLGSEEQYQSLTLVVPDQMQLNEKIAERAHDLEIDCLSFETEHQITFQFDEMGILQTHPQFKETLSTRVAEFLHQDFLPEVTIQPNLSIQLAS